MKKQPKYKVCRRLGPGVYEQCQTDAFALAESRKKDTRKRRRRSASDYNTQLLEKQKVRFSYGINERQFRGYVNEALHAPGQVVTKKLFELLESRLDNVVYRLGLAPTRRAARQMVVHGHILVDGKRMRVPSHKVSKNNVVTVREQSRAKGLWKDEEENDVSTQTPDWLVYEPKKFQATVKGVPQLDETNVAFDLSSVIEFYSR